MIAADFPLRSLTSVFHVGTLDEKNKGTWSFEGKGLSVSLHPEEWMHIARLSGSIQELLNPDGRFLDYYAMSQEQRAEARAWAISKGYLTQREVYVARWYDDEWGEEMMTLCSDHDEAEFYAGDSVTVERRDALTDLALANAGFAESGAQSDVMFAEDAVALLYAEEVLQVDGVWFEERLDPLVLSAPRGVILPNQVAKWTRRSPSPAPLSSTRARGPTP